jgi:hypothetical protein
MHAGRTYFICVDDEAEGVYDSNAPSPPPSAGLLVVEYGGNMADDYIDNLEVTCARCSSSDGPVYVRWGRSTCPMDARLVYSGRAGGADVDANGGGHNYVCLHLEPTYQDWDTNPNLNSPKLYRVEYETLDRGLSELWALQDADVPCAGMMRQHKCCVS